MIFRFECQTSFGQIFYIKLIENLSKKKYVRVYSSNYVYVLMFYFEKIFKTCFYVSKHVLVKKKHFF